VRRSDLVTAGVALAVHAGIALAVVRAGKAPERARPRKALVLEYQKAKPPEAAPEPPPPKPRAPRAVHKVAFKPHAAPARHAAAPPPEANPSPSPAPAPRYAVAMTSPTDSGSAMAVPGGAHGGTGTGGATSGNGTTPGGTGTGFHPVSAREVGSMPDVDTDACGRAAVYPRNAERSGTEGDVRLRVALTEQGKVHDVRVLTSLGREFDQAAMDAIKNRCKFKPATSRDGQPVAFVIQSYTFHFELPR
jgi:TonB family protein